LDVNIKSGSPITISGLTGFKILQSFARPSDGNAYAALDAITNSTSSPAIMSQDLSAQGAVAGKFFVITNARIVSSGAASAINCNVILFPASFTATNDNSALSIDDTTAALGGIVIPCSNFYNLGANSRCVSDPGWWEGQLGTASTTLYFCLQAISAFTPVSGETYTVILEGFFF
jgi:hypothetical protein